MSGKFDTLSIIFENEFFLVVFKPSGLLTIPSRFKDELTLLDRMKDRSSFVLPVHRLDREVSGLVLLAKNEESHAVACSWFELRTVQKFYEAITCSDASFDVHSFRASQTWESYLVKGKKRTYEAPFGKKSTTKVSLREVLDWAEPKLLRWDVNPVTGRSHQIRFELSKHRFPIVGDLLYGSKKRFHEKAIALRATLLDFSNCSYKKWGLPSKVKVTGFTLEDFQSG